MATIEIPPIQFDIEQDAEIFSIEAIKADIEILLISVSG